MTILFTIIFENVLAGYIYPAGTSGSLCNRNILWETSSSRGGLGEPDRHLEWVDLFFIPVFHQSNR